VSAKPTPQEIEDHYAWVDSLYADEEPVVIDMNGRVID
jgi:hypothetical protein